jgi:hypothetical protein
MDRWLLVIVVMCAVLSLACGSAVQPTNNAAPAEAPAPASSPSTSPKIPDLQRELLSGENSTSDSAIAKFDFKNYTYELPRGWQNPDGTTDITLVNGHVAPKSTQTNESMDEEQKMVAKSERRIGMSYVTTKFFDLTGDGQDEAVVVLKVETEGSAIPQLAYVFEWKSEKPELIWPFRTGDRADGGHKNLRVENGQLVIELFGQDRFILGQTETGKITDDVEQLCCPTYFTRSAYKWNGKNFLMQGKRLTYSMADPDVPPIENLGEKVNDPQKSGQRPTRK